MSRPSGSLFDVEGPDGWHYCPDFITVGEEAALVEQIGGVEFSSFEMRGVVARRRVAFFGRSYDAMSTSARPLPPFLMPLREKVAAWSGIDAKAFEMALINEYPPGAPIGWHRDAPQYDVVAGISLLSPCRMKFRPYVQVHPRPSGSTPRRTATHEMVLDRRSAYRLTGAARSAYEHHIPAVTTRRYSITFRTLR